MIHLTETKKISSHLKRLLIFISMPGGGKTVLSKLLLLLLQTLNHGVGHKQYKRLATSDLIRSEMDDLSSPLRNSIIAEAPATLNVGRLLSNQLTIQILDRHLVRNYWDDGRVMILDGFPRNTVQGEATLDLKVPATAIHLRVNDEKLSFKRIAERAEKEGRYYDATPEKVRDRLNVYKDETHHVLGQLTGFGPDIVQEIDASLDFETKVRLMLVAIDCNKNEIDQMMIELRKPGSLANNMMRETLGLPKLLVTTKPYTVRQQLVQS